MSKPEKFYTPEDEITFNILNPETVRKLEREGDIILPKKKVDVPKDMRWNTKQMASKLYQGILGGDSIPKIAKSLMEVIGNNKASAVRNARTMVTGAENAGRLDSYNNLAEQGVVQKKEWIATPDDRTRESHIAVDGEERDIDKPFSNGLMYPGDPSGAPAEVWNCRCTMGTNIVGFRKADGSVSKVDYTADRTLHEDQMQAEKERRAAENQLTPAQETAKSDVLKRLEAGNIVYNAVSKMTSSLPEQEIIDKIGGGDLTEGSCASLSLTYAGNKADYDVTDFRGGDSRMYFARTANLADIAHLEGVEGYVLKNTNDFKTTSELLKNVTSGNEYILGVGKHAAIIKQAAEGLQYLELQSATNNGWKALNNTVLKNRFDCKKSHTLMGTKVEKTGVLIEVKSLGNNSEFKDLLGYINTDASKQMKGAAGHEK